MVSQVPERPRRRIILCFDGTGNKFSGTDADSNILKIYRMLDRNNGDKHYYQPGIGTYVKGALSHTSMVARVNSWYAKAKDSAIGTSFDEHVMGAYKFLMSCYDNDDIYFFGFSRGAYVARFLAEMLDNVGLLSQGNEEMARFAWKAFAQWQERDESTEEEKKKKKEMLHYLQAFRDTFSRPVRRIRFLGLFDTVNSVPRFENAWMQRSKFPYTARSSAKVIRHAVSIDERRAKFRQDLISGEPPKRHGKIKRKYSIWVSHAERGRRHDKLAVSDINEKSAVNGTSGFGVNERFRPTSQNRAINQSRSRERPSVRSADNKETEAGMFLQSREHSLRRSEQAPDSSIHSGASSFLPAENTMKDELSDDEVGPQDIEELWFPGCHADLGGGWQLWPGEETSLSHGPLVWMVREAQRAGLEFDPDKMLQLKCCEDPLSGFSWENDAKKERGPSGQLDAKKAPLVRPPAPDIQVIGSSNDNIDPRAPDISITPLSLPSESLEPPQQQATASSSDSPFQRALRLAATKGMSHDCLEFRNGLPTTSVLSWKMMEYMPFRRMDLRPDGSWKAISFPLPMGETRDIPSDAKIHISAIRRMKANENYRPGNLIIGGGGRGIRTAPKEMGMGEWEPINGGDEDMIGGAYRRVKKADIKKG